MRYALRLARKGMGSTSPNPMVGALLIKRGKMVGKGYHKRKGEPHAEAIAIEDAGDEASGSMLFVTLEPCVHYGKTSPCVDKIIKAGIRKVYVAALDPNPIVYGNGVRRLQQEGIEVEVGLCRSDAMQLNEAYNKFIVIKQPFIILKAAITLDGKIATHNCKSRWITDTSSRTLVHKLRSTVDAVLVGLNTVKVDNPLLTTRLVEGKNPKRIVLDSKLSIPENAKILGDDCIVATTISRDRNIRAEVWHLKRDKRGKVDLKDLVQKAGEKDITSLLVEGGREVFTSFLKEGLVDKFYLFIGNRILGDGGVSFIGDLGISKLEDSFRIRYESVRRIGKDLLITAYPLF